MDEQDGNGVTFSYDLLRQLVSLGFQVPGDLEAACRKSIGIAIDLAQSVLPGVVRVLLAAVEKVCEMCGLFEEGKLRCGLPMN